MKNIKDELQHIILGDEPSCTGSALKKVQTFLRGYAQAGFDPQKQQYLKSKQAEAILAFANEQNLFYSDEISKSDFINEGIATASFSEKILLPGLRDSQYYRR